MARRIRTTVTVRVLAVELSFSGVEQPRGPARASEDGPSRDHRGRVRAETGTAVKTPITSTVSDGGFR
jgi:hypothetical protein